MEPVIRISTSPPEGWDGNQAESSHYCDLHTVADWQDHRLLREVAEPFKGEALRSGIAGYRVVPVYGDKSEIGLLVCVEDEEEGVMYLGIDLGGRTCREPAVNEALWSVANAAAGPARRDR